MLKSPNARNVAVLLVLSYIFFMLGNSILYLTNPDEVFYSQTAREMMQKKSWMTPYLFGQPQFEKPIMTFWLLRLAFEIGGAGSFSARFFPALFGAIGIIAIYFLGLLGFKDEKKALVSALVMMSSGFYIGLARTVFTDMIFSVFILLSLLAFYWAYAVRKRQSAGWLLFFVLSAMAVLTKGPLGLLIPLVIVTIFLFLKKEAGFFKNKGFFLGIIAFCLLALPWYVFMIRTYGQAFIHEFFYNDHIRRLIEAEHRGADTWYFYPFGSIASLFPWSIFLVIGLVYSFKNRKEAFDLFLLLWVAVVFIIFQSAHSKLVSYVFPFFPALALITGGWLTHELSSGRRKALFVSFLATGAFCVSVPVAATVAPFAASSYVPKAASVFVFAGLAAVYLAVFFVHAFRRNFKADLLLLVVFLPMTLGFSLFMAPHYQSFVSSKEAGLYLKSHCPEAGKILCSKFYARGIRYFTDREVAVIDINGKGFFSPHPVEYINTVEKLRAFLDGQQVTCAVLRKGHLKDLEELIGPSFRYEMLHKAGDEYIVRILPAQFKDNIK